jgi:hypothetical protein
MRDLAVSWGKDGATVLARVAKENPASYFSVCARLLPSDVAISIQHQAPALDARDLSILRAIRDAIPNANELEPHAVLEYALNAIRSYDAKLITSEHWFSWFYRLCYWRRLTLGRFREDLLHEGRKRPGQKREALSSQMGRASQA